MSRATLVRDVFVRRIHEAAAVFDDEGRAAEFLDIRQRFEQRFGFGDEVLHALIPSRKPRRMESAFRHDDFTFAGAGIFINCRRHA